ncbi:nucleotidyltransferase family protein [Pararobbsia alpina]|uniref:Bifunctional protein GlmU n=1 Tax=Pararobbsia alpina TaxID=621374 RepID=A0A6S7D3X9_9BURK|nr:nucleotidyltransferase family protein [Pararobbsia alpina]CAB3795280.1 Bifunctional protein GlmU [Pararobbsia alpina]
MNEPGTTRARHAALSFSAVVLAAGMSTRMPGKHKLLLPIDGQPAVRRTVSALIAAGPEEIVIVTGFNAHAIVDALNDLPVRFQFNPHYEEGQVTSVAAGVAALNAPCSVVLVCLADQVLLCPDDYRELIDAYGAMPRGSILVPTCNGQRGNPVAFSASYATEVISGHVNPGCKKLIAEHPDEVFVHEALHDRFALDMDTPEDYARVLTRLGLGGVTIAVEPRATT